MNLLTPMTGLILAAAVVPPLVLLYFLKLRRRSQPIASTLLWKKSIDDLQANAPFQKLRRNLLLLLQLLALLFLIVSVMQPQIQASGQDGGKTVLLIDNSASMTATDTDDGTARLEEAKQRARDRIEALYGGGLLANSPGETMIVAFSDRAEIMSRFSSSKQELLTAIDRIGATHGVTNVSEALKLARAYTTNVDPDSDRPVSSPATLEVFSDGRIADMDDQVLRGERMVFHRLGRETADNVAIAAISVERPYDRPTAVEVFASFLNFNETDVVCEVQLSIDVTALDVRDITIDAARRDPRNGELLPGRKSVLFLPFEQPRGAVIEVANLRIDDLAADNVAQVVVAPPKQLSVALVNASDFLIRTVLEGLTLQKLELVTSAQYERLAEDGGLDAYDVIVFDDYAPPADRMPPGRYLAFGAPPPVEGLNPFGEGGVQIVLDARDEHPILRFARLDDLYILRCQLIQPADDVEVLVEGSEGPVVVSVSRGPMQLVYVAFDPAQSNWPLLRSWVTFNFNAIDYLGHLGEGLTSRGFAVGDALTTRLPAAAGAIELRTPGDDDGFKLTPSDPTMLTWGPIRLAGLYRLAWDDPLAEERQSRTFAVNVASEREGLIAPLENLQIGQDQIAGVAASASAYTPLWPYAIGFCLAVLMLEWWVYHRKTYL